MVRKVKHYCRYFLVIIALISITPILCYLWIGYYSRPYLYNNTEDIPYNDVAIVLGTAKYLTSQHTNPFYKARIDAAIALYNAGKARYFIVSGANPSAYYNEPEEMQKDLIKAGIPKANIQPDYAGLRTLDSVLRADKVFGQKRYTIISQSFHNARAVFLARHSGQTVIAFNAADPQSNFFNTRVKFREIGARLKAVVDIFIINKQAKFYGEKITFPKKSL